MRTLPGLTRIAMSGWTYQACDPAAIAELDRRAADLGCYVSTVKRTRAPSGWVVRAFSAARTGVVEVRAKGGLEVAIAGALDRYEAAQRDRYTADELVVIYGQSGGADAG